MTLKSLTHHQRALHRIKIVQGQVKNIQKMIKQDTYCVDILTQSLAVQKALSSLNNHLLAHHLEHCVLDQVKAGQNEKVLKELKQLYHLSNK